MDDRVRTGDGGSNTSRGSTGRESTGRDDRESKVGVIDKSMLVLDAIAAGSRTLADLVASTGLSRATAHRLAAALEVHGLVRRADDGSYALGSRLWVLGQQVEGPAALADLGQPLLDELRDQTGESSQLFVVDGGMRLCVAAAESSHGLRTIVPIGSRLPLDLGSGGAALRGDAEGGAWVESVGEREAGVASVSAPVLGADGDVVAAVSVSGPIDRLSTNPGTRHGAAVVEAAARLGDQLVSSRLDR